ncbi:MAG: energy transducer TonB [Treponema sp.]|jgi:protein TonB|nr:energy transducer TonB [Treponema sp.]
MNFKRLRLLLFVIVALLHIVLIFTIVFTARPSPPPPREARVMKLTDLAEERQPPPETRETPPSVLDAEAETMIETEEIPDTAGFVRSAVQSAEEAYLPMHQVSVRPVFDEKLITSLLVYPPIALRSGVEGRVILDLFIDRSGLVRNIVIMREDPPDRGFGEAAVRAFTGLRCVPAQANGENVSVRCRYPVAFKIK